MKFMKFCALSAIALMASFAFADANDKLITFSTVADKYADGTTVVDGEWYALVWIKSGATFDGLTTRMQAVNPDTNEVVLAAPLAKDGRCPPVLFEVDSAKVTELGAGTYKVFMLDTRNVSGTPAEPDEDGCPKLVNAMAETDAAVSTGTYNVVLGSSVSEPFAETNTDGIEAPTITAFEVVGANVKITVSGMVPSVNYAIRKGATIEGITTTNIKMGAEKNDVEILLEKGDANFFSVGRAKLAE